MIGLLQISLFVGLTEGKFYPGDAWIGQLDREPGDLGFDPLKLSKKDLSSLQLKELKNGRAAMIGFAGFITNHFVPGSNPLITGMYAQRPEAPTASTQGRFCGATRTTGMSTGTVQSKTAARYTTQVILPSLTWLKTGVKAGDLAPTQLKAKTIGGNDVLIGKDENGKIFCVGNLCPHIGTPMSEGADVIGDVIVCPLHGSSFKVTTGELIDWCPSPPIIGPLTGLLIDKKNLLVFDIRESGFLGGGELEVLVDTNAKRAYEAGFWKGVLDAQGKVDGSLY
jgi:nitrite reductase/ring-hydroxylating ferredoxin subunit